LQFVSIYIVAVTVAILEGEGSNGFPPRHTVYAFTVTPCWGIGEFHLRFAVVPVTVNPVGGFGTGFGPIVAVA
jgi:hypothetical protein